MKRTVAALVCLLLPAAAWPAAAVETAARLPGAAPLELNGAALPEAAPPPSLDAAPLPASLALPPAAASPEPQAEAGAAAASSASAAPARPGAVGDLQRIESAVAPPPGASGSDPAASRERADDAWTAAAPASGGAPTPEPPTPPRSRGLLRRLAPLAVPVLAAPALAPRLLDHGQGLALKLGHVWHQAAPYAGAAAGVGAVYYLSRLARWAVTKIGARAGWSPNRIVVARLLASGGAWIIGGLAGLQAAGISAQTVFASLGVGSLALSIAATDVIGNVYQAVKILAVQPFRLEDTIIIGGDGGSKYTVKRFSLRFVHFLNAKGVPWFWTYLQLGGKTITVLREYAPTAAPSALRRSLDPLAAWDAAKDKRVSLAKTSLGGAVAGAALFSLPWLRGLLAPTPFAFLLPWAQGLAILFAIRQAGQWVVAVIDRLADSQHWDPRSRVLVRLGAQVAVVLGGLSLGVYTYGVTLPYVLTMLGGTTIALVMSQAGSSILGNFLQAFYLLYFQPYRIGDVVTISGITGKVIDLNWWHVVLEHSDKTFTLIPYSVIATEAFGEPKADADTSRPRSQSEKDAAAATPASSTPSQPKTTQDK